MPLGRAYTLVPLTTTSYCLHPLLPQHVHILEIFILHIDTEYLLASDTILVVNKTKSLPTWNLNSSEDNKHYSMYVSNKCNRAIIKYRWGEQCEGGGILSFLESQRRPFWWGDNWAEMKKGGSHKWGAVNEAKNLHTGTKSQLKEGFQEGKSDHLRQTLQVFPNTLARGYVE